MKLFFTRLGYFTLLLLTQVFVFNHISLMGYATPLVYSYLLCLFPRSSSRISVILWAFLLGLAVDLFSNTPGMGAGSMALTGLLQPVLLGLLTDDKEEEEDLLPNPSSLGKTNYFFFLTSLVFIQVTTFSVLEFFSIFNWKELLTNVAFSTLLTLAMLLGIDLARSMTHRKRRR